MSATEVARNFSAVITRVLAGEEIEVIRNGAPVVELHPPSKPRSLKGEAWRRFVKCLPAVDPEFAREVQDARGKLGHPMPAWRS